MLIDAGSGDKMTAKQAEHLSASSASSTCQHSLAAAGVVARTRSTSSWRRTCISITPAGLPNGRRRVRPAAVPARAVRRSAAASGKTRRTRTSAPRAAISSRTTSRWPTTSVLQLVDEDVTIMPGVRVRRTGGHTMHHQMVMIESAGKTAVFAADLLPTAAHLPEVWVMGYDLLSARHAELQASLPAGSHRARVSDRLRARSRHRGRVHPGEGREAVRREGCLIGRKEPRAAGRAMSSMTVQIGVIGGSGLYDMAELTDREERTVKTPFGDPSGPYLLGTLRGKRVAFLARHGAGHRLLPSELNFRANIFGFKLLGRRAHHLGQRGRQPQAGISAARHRRARSVLRSHDRRASARSSATDSRRTWRSRIRSVPSWRESAPMPSQAAGATVHRGGTYVCMEGPQFSTLAESKLYRSWGMDVIGMTNLQEAKLAREAEICYVTLALVTDYDCWHPDHDSVTVEMIVQTLMQNAQTAQRAIAEAITKLPVARSCECGSALKYRAHHATGSDSGAGQDRTSRPSSENTFHESHPRRRLGRVRFHQDSVRRSVARRRRRRDVFRDRRVVLHRSANRRRRRRGFRRQRREGLRRPHGSISTGLEKVPGETFRWKGEYRLRPQQPRDDLHAPERLRALQAEDSRRRTGRRRSCSWATSIPRCRSTCSTR